MNEDRHVAHETLTAFLDGELAPIERARVDAHLAECADCRATLASWAVVERDLDAATPALSEEDWNALAARVDRAIEAEEGTEATARPSPKVESSWRELVRRLAPRPLAWSAAGAFATALLVILLLPHEQSFTPVEKPAATPLPATEEDSKDTIESGDIATLEKKDADRSDAAPSKGALSSSIDEGKSEAESPAATKPRAPALQQEAAPRDASADVRADDAPLAALRDSLAALDERRANSVKSPAAAPSEGFAKSKSLQSSNAMRREAAGGGVSAERDAAPAPDSLLAREIELVAALVASDADAFCEEARTRRARWESDAGFALLSEESRVHLAAIDAACPK